MVRKTELKRKAGLRSRAIKASCPPVTSEERAAKKAVKRRSGGLCEACGERRAVHWHHRINEGQGGAWAAANGMHVCLACHIWIGDFPLSAGLLGWHLEPWRDREGRLVRDPATEPLRYRGVWVVLGEDGAITHTEIPDLRRAAAESAHQRRAAA